GAAAGGAGVDGEALAAAVADGEVLQPGFLGGVVHGLRTGGAGADVSADVVPALAAGGIALAGQGVGRGILRVDPGAATWHGVAGDRAGRYFPFAGDESAGADGGGKCAGKGGGGGTGGGVWGVHPVAAVYFHLDDHAPA